MIMLGFTLENILIAGIGLLMLPMLFALWRGPTTSDRILALDTLGTLGVLILATLSITNQRTIYLDLALLVALFNFLGTLVIARYLERGLLE